MDLPTRRVLPRWLDVHTPVTCTPNSDSTACLTSDLVASGWTWNVYSPRAWNAAELFSVTTGRTMISCSVGIAHFPRFFGLPLVFFAAVFLDAVFLTRAVVVFFFFAGAASRLAPAFFAALRA